MRLNENTKIIGQRVILVPYKAQHVEKYHQWMQDPVLQQLTASEPLTLEQEKEMQSSWHEDEDKLTFLVLDKEHYDRTADEISALVGDTNLFLRPQEGASVDKVAEAEIMIAEPLARGKRFGWEAMLLMLKYAQEQLQLTKFEVKIGIENERSLRMFEAMQFVETGRSPVFAEITMERTVTLEWLRWLNAEVPQPQCVQYMPNVGKVINIPNSLSL